MRCKSAPKHFSGSDYLITSVVEPETAGAGAGEKAPAPGRRNRSRLDRLHNTAHHQEKGWRKLPKNVTKTLL